MSILPYLTRVRPQRTLSCLENLPSGALTCLLKQMEHEAKLSLRLTSRRMFELVSALDKTFNYWTFDPCMKEDIPYFVLESNKKFQIHIKDLEKKWERVEKDYESESEDDSDKNSDEDYEYHYDQHDYDEEEDDDDEERTKRVEMVVKFMSKHAKRVVSFKVTCFMYYADFALVQDLLDELENLQPKWKNLKSFELHNTYTYEKLFYYNDVAVKFKNMSKLFESCENSLEKLVFVGISLQDCHDLKLLNLKTVMINSCIVGNLGTSESFSHLEEIAITMFKQFDEEKDVDITPLLSSDLSKLRKLNFDQAAISVEEPLHLNCVNLKSIRLTMNVSVAGLEDFLVFCSPTLEALDLKCVSTDMHPNELDFSKLATQSWKIKDLRLVLTNKLRGLNHYKDLKKFLKGCSFLEKLSLEVEVPNAFDAIDYDDDIDDSCNIIDGYSGDMDGDFEDDSVNEDVEDKSYEEGLKQINVNIKANSKLENLPLKYLCCPTYFLEQISASCCEHISELNIKCFTEGFADLKFPGLNVLTIDRKDKHLVNILFENAQVKESHNPLFGYKYERAFSYANESSSGQLNKIVSDSTVAMEDSTQKVFPVSTTSRSNGSTTATTTQANIHYKQYSITSCLNKKMETPRNLLTPIARF